MVHKTVLLQEAIDGLDIKVGEIFFDGTLGGGGHSTLVANTFGKKVKIIATDLDTEAIERATERISKTDSNFKAYNESFRNIDKVLEDGGEKKIDKALFDLGLSSNQFEDSGRGFTFQKNEPLSMTFRKEVKEGEMTARDIVNDWDEEHIVDILKGYGEESFAEKIAQKICEKRLEKPIETTDELVEIVKLATPNWYQHKKINPATKTFQALRITVNDELRSLEEGLRKTFELLNSHGRIAVISFHSLEDRIVKNIFREWSKEEKGILINKKPITPSRKEILENRRSRSAKLRIIEKTP